MKYNTGPESSFGGKEQDPSFDTLRRRLLRMDSISHWNKC